MVFCVVNEGVSPELDLPDCDVAVFGFGGLGEVDYEKELKGESEEFERLTKISKKFNCGVVCACKTLSRGLKRKSCAVADRGKLLGISDMTHVLDGEPYKSGAQTGFYRTGGYNLGLCIENDLLFPDTVKSLALCGCNAVIALAEELKDNLPPLIIRSYAYLYGIPVVLAAGNIAYFADVTGAIASSNQPIALFEISAQNRYHLVTTRVKGIYGETKLDY